MDANENAQARAGKHAETEKQNWFIPRRLKHIVKFRVLYFLFDTHGTSKIAFQLY
jgi:hypothetical protein